MELLSFKNKLEPGRDVQIPSQLSSFKQALFIFEFHKVQKTFLGGSTRGCCSGINKKKKILANYRKDMKRMVAKKEPMLQVFFFFFLFFFLYIHKGVTSIGSTVTVLLTETIVFFHSG